MVVSLFTSLGVSSLFCCVLFFCSSYIVQEPWVYSKGELTLNCEKFCPGYPHYTFSSVSKKAKLHLRSLVSETKVSPFLFCKLKQFIQGS